jgi:hypothetical protein
VFATRKSRVDDSACLTDYHSHNYHTIIPKQNAPQWYQEKSIILNVFLVTLVWRQRCPLSFFYGNFEMVNHAEGGGGRGGRASSPHR